MVGIPMVDTGKLISPRPTATRSRSRPDREHQAFELRGHPQGVQADALAIEAFETRVLVGHHPDDPARLKSAPFPQEMIQKFMSG